MSDRPLAFSFCKKSVNEMKRIGNLSILFNYTTLGDPPFEFKGTAWTEVVFRHGREREERPECT